MSASEQEETEQAIRPSISSEEARQILAQEEAKRIQDCQRELQTVLDKYGCILDVSVILRPGQVIPQVQIMARQDMA
jgi:hypothetical protein